MIGAHKSLCYVLPSLPAWPLTNYNPRVSEILLGLQCNRLIAGGMREGAGLRHSPSTLGQAGQSLLEYPMFRGETLSLKIICEASTNVLFSSSNSYGSFDTCKHNLSSWSQNRFQCDLSTFSMKTDFWL